MSACGNTSIIHTLKKVDASISTIPKNTLYTSKRSRRNSSPSSPRLTRRSRYARLLQHIKLLVKRRCTDAIFSHVQQTRPLSALWIRHCKYMKNRNVAWQSPARSPPGANAPAKLRDCQTKVHPIFIRRRGSSAVLTCAHPCCDAPIRCGMPAPHRMKVDGYAKHGNFPLAIAKRSD